MGFLLLFWSMQKSASPFRLKRCLAHQARGFARSSGRADQNSVALLVQQAEHPYQTRGKGKYTPLCKGGQNVQYFFSIASLTGESYIEDLSSIAVEQIGGWRAERGANEEPPIAAGRRRGNIRLHRLSLFSHRLRLH